MIFSESYFATAPFSRKRSEPSTASTLPASGCGERLVPHFDHLELRGPAFGFKAVALGSHGALLGAPLCAPWPYQGRSHPQRRVRTRSAPCTAPRGPKAAFGSGSSASYGIPPFCLQGGDASALKRPYFTFFFNKTCVKRPKNCVKNVLNRCARLCPLLQFVRKGCRIQSQSNTGELVKQAERKYPNFDPFT